MTKHTRCREAAGHSGPQNDPKPAKSARRRWLALAVVSFAVAAVLAYGVRSRVRASKKLGAETSQLAVTQVSVVSPKQLPLPRRSSCRGTYSLSSVRRFMHARMDTSRIGMWISERPSSKGSCLL